MYFELRENKVHGTKDFPFMDYHINNIDRPFQIPVHWHDEMEILHILKGPLTVVIEGVEYSAKKNDIFIVNPGELHLMGSIQKGSNYHSFVFPLELISFQSEDALEELFFKPLRNGKKRFVNYIPVQMANDKMYEALTELQGIYSQRQSYQAQLMARLLLLSFLSQLQDSKYIKVSSDEKGTLGRDILTYLQQNYTGEIRLSDLSSELHLSEKYISRYFKQSFHITISQYIGHLRISRAKLLLSTTCLPITDVALQSGFQDVSYFIRSFHKSCGISPLKYRFQNR